jgi:hypothetical protein
VRRLAVKICLDLAILHEKRIGWLGDEERGFLLGDRLTSSVVRNGIIDYPDLNEVVPPLSHTAYLEFNEQTGTAFGVVQFFRTIQFYLAFTGHDEGPSFALLGVLDNCSSIEIFREVQPLRLATVPHFGEATAQEAAMVRWKKQLDAQVREVFGENVLLFSEASA